MRGRGVIMIGRAGTHGFIYCEMDEPIPPEFQAE